MRALWIGLVISTCAGVSFAQTMTNCSGSGPFVNCNTIGPGGMATTNCNRVGPTVSCNTFGSPNLAAQPPAASSGSDNAGSAVIAGAALGLLAARGIQAEHQRREQGRIKSVIPLIVAHDCSGAVALAQKENDAQLAQRIPAVCKTKEEAGEEPLYLISTAPDPLFGEWARRNLRLPIGSRYLSGDKSIAQFGVPTSAQTGHLWVRSEAISPDGVKAIGGRSSLLLASFDCTQGTFSIQATTIYAGQNLTGSSRSDDHPSAASSIRPGSRAEVWSREVCPGPAATPSTVQPVASAQ